MSLAEQFAFSIELLDGGILFEVSGLENLIGDPSQIARSISSELNKRGLLGNVAVAENASLAILHAQNSNNVTVSTKKELHNLPLLSLNLEPETLGIFHALGLRDIGDLKDIPTDDLIARYGQEFKQIIDLIQGNGKHVLKTNLKENQLNWTYDLDFLVSDFERLIFIVGRGLDDLLNTTAESGFSTEQIDVDLGLHKKPSRLYEVKTSFPNLEKNFWVKLINLRISIDPPEAEITSIGLTSHFTRSRTVQHGLYSATKPEPESLLLTVSKIKKLVGENNVGIPTILNQRLQQAFALDAERFPVGRESPERTESLTVLAFNYYTPPLPAEVTVTKGRLIYLKTREFKGRVIEYGGIWRASSQWWNKLRWKTEEWDVEIENNGIYRLLRNGKEWFVTGVYD